MINQTFMIEVFSGTATLCSVAKQNGLSGSLAPDKVRKKGARSAIFVFDILNPKDRELLYHWLDSPLLVWVIPLLISLMKCRAGGPEVYKEITFFGKITFL